MIEALVVDIVARGLPVSLAVARVLRHPNTVAKVEDVQVFVRVPNEEVLVDRKGAALKILEALTRPFVRSALVLEQWQLRYASEDRAFKFVCLKHYSHRVILVIPTGFVLDKRVDLVAIGEKRQCLAAPNASLVFSVALRVRGPCQSLLIAVGKRDGLGALHRLERLLVELNEGLVWCLRVSHEQHVFVAEYGDFVAVRITHV